MPEFVKSEFRRAPISTIAAIIASFCAIGTLITGVALAVRWTESIERRLEYNERQDEAHTTDVRVHMPYAEKIKAFVLRQEWQASLLAGERQFADIKASQLRTEQKLDRLIDKFIQ